MHAQPEDRGAGPLLLRLAHLAGELERRAAEGGTPGAGRPFKVSRRPGAHRERPALHAAWLTIVLAGCMVARGEGGGAVRARRGELLLLPAEATVELASGPDPETGEYLALDLEVMAEALVRWLPVEAALGSGLAASALVVRTAGPAALAALTHLCEGLLEEAHPWLLQHRLEAVLLAVALEEQAAGLQDAALARLDAGLAARHLVRASPTMRWTLGAVAKALGLSRATLRRRLAQGGTGLRRIVAEERVHIAKLLLRDGRLGVSEVALRCGYGSPSKFARAFKQAVGVAPSSYRHPQ